MTCNVIISGYIVDASAIKPKGNLPDSSNDELFVLSRRKSMIQFHFRFETPVFFHIYQSTGNIRFT